MRTPRCKGTRVFCLGWIVVFTMCVVGPPSHAKPQAGISVLVVTTTSDSTDIDDGERSLREALLAANASPEADEIRFDLPGVAPHTISVATPLPALTGTVIIDGYSQPDAFTAPTVRLDGGATGGSAPFDGLVLAGMSSVVRGLSITNFGGNGIVLAGRGRHWVQGCTVGANGDWSTPNGNGGDGILINSSGNQIGGVSDVVPLLGNLVAGNGGAGVRIASGDTNRLQSNYIGVGLDGRLGLGNRGDGVLVAAGTGNVVGGTVKGSGNWIAFNGGAGVRVLPQPGAAVMLNTIEKNAGLGIDVLDGGTGEHGSVPSIASVVSSRRTTSITAEIEGAAWTEYRVELFANSAPDPSGHGEGEALLGVVLVATDGGGRGSLQVRLPFVIQGWVSATQTHVPLSITSSFAACVAVRPRSHL